MGPGASPTHLENLDKLFLAWEGARGIVAAISGGPDSMALLHMLARWRDAGAGPKIHAATVNHGLRPEAAEEALQVERLAHSLSIGHATLHWRHDRPVARLQELAREARYDLLARHAMEVGADVLMTGHHGDDQAETILFRLLRGSSVAGLAGMAVESERAGLRLVRPLLGHRKRDLIAYCERNRIEFCNDPSNQDRGFARSRMRDILPVLEEEGLGPDEWARLARRVNRIESALNVQARAAYEQAVTADADGALGLDMAKLAQAPEEIVLRVLTACMVELIGKKPRLERIETLVELLLEAFRAGRHLNATLGGACISLSQGGSIIIRREPRRKRGIKNSPANSPSCPKKAPINE